MTDLAVLADDGGALNHHAILDDRTFADKNIIADEGHTVAFVFQRRFQVRLEVALDFFQRVPGVLAAVKNCGVFALLQVKQIGWLEHGRKLSEKGETEK